MWQDNKSPIAFGGFHEMVKKDHDVQKNSIARLISSAACGDPLELVFNYWHHLSAGKGIPKRTSLDPGPMESALANSFILERIAPGVARFRTAGQHLSDIMGMSVHGMPLTALFHPEARKDAAAAVKHVCEDPSLTLLGLRAPRCIGGGALEARMFLAPLRDENGYTTRLLGCLEASGRIGRQPRRFLVKDMQREELPKAVTGRFTDQVHTLGMAEEPTRFEHREQKRAGTLRPALRLVVNNDA